MRRPELSATDLAIAMLVVVALIFFCFNAILSERPGRPIEQEGWVETGP